MLRTTCKESGAFCAGGRRCHTGAFPIRSPLELHAGSVRIKAGFNVMDGF